MASRTEQAKAALRRGPAEARPAQSQTAIFSRLVRDYMRAPPLVVPRDSTVEDLIGRMAAAKTTSALIVDEAGRLAGIVTEQDVVRRVALRCAGGEALAGVMTAPVQTIGADDYLYYAIARMRRFGWRHMPVVDREQRPLGMIDLHDALAVAGVQVLRQIERVSHEGSLDGLREIKVAQVELAYDLFDDNVPAPEIQALITHINNDIHRRILKAGLDAMAAEGWGTPPVDFALLIMGSGGRGENFLYPDQDNGFILDDYPDSEHGRIDGFFIELAERMTRDLDAVGFPLCGGYVMATNPVWRKTRSQWREQVSFWGRKRSTIVLQFSDIFFDFRAAYGARHFADELREAVTRMARASPAFLSELQREVARTGVALGWFGRLRTESDKPEHKGKINLKHSGTMPLVSNLRLFALREGIAESGTRARIDALHAAGVLSDDEADYLRGAFRHITGLLLRQQLRDFQAGAEVTNYVALAALSERERDILIDSLKAIEELGKRVRHEFTGEIF
ncbi:MAG: putative nucleotidyltransferase substrate binding domain-containing protein [Kiloniellales bacterium]